VIDDHYRQDCCLAKKKKSTIKSSQIPLHIRVLPGLEGYFGKVASGLGIS